MRGMLPCLRIPELTNDPPPSNIWILVERHRNAREKKKGVNPWVQR